MDIEALNHCLTEDERRIFNETGVLTLENALSPDRIEALTQLTDRIFERKLREGHSPNQSLFYPDFIPEDPLFLDLIDEPKVFPKVWGLLGWNIYLYHAHLIVTPPSGAAPDTTNKTFGWHQDSGRVNVEMESHPRPRLSLKVAYFLSDTSEPGRGNFWVIPSSHLRDSIERPPDGIGQPEGAVPVCVKPGTAVLFDRRTWHTATPNYSSITRKVLFYGYGYRWIRTKDDMTVRDLWPRCDPIRKQILGWSVNCNGHFSPTDEDVPLRGWLKEYQPQDAR